jgi:hypothetical protein
LAKSSIHIEKGKIGFLFHNDRTQKTVNSIFSDEENEYSNNGENAVQIFRNELKKRSDAYTKRTKQKLQKNAVTHLSAIVNLNANHKLEELYPICDLLEKTLDTKVFQVAIHRDEGHIKNGKAIKNYHAHIEFLGLDSTGASVRRKLDKRFLSNLQEQVATLLQMERGHNYARERIPRPKRLNTYEFKEAKKREEEALKSAEFKTVKELKAKMEEMRKQMIAQNQISSVFTKEDYQSLAKLKKTLKKANLSQITDEFIKLKQELEQKTQDIAELEEIAYEDKQTNLSREKTADEIEEDDFYMISPTYDEDGDVILPRASYKVLYQREVEKKQEMKETLSELVEKIAKLETKIAKLESQRKQQTEKMEEQQMQKTVVEQPKPLAPSR